MKHVGSILVVAVGVSLTVAVWAASSTSIEWPSSVAKRDGTIAIPDGYKTTWAHLGDWAVARKQGDDVVEFHEVYTQPGVIEAFNETGEFPDGAVLVKEVRQVERGELNTGYAAWAAKLDHTFVMIKDRKNRHPGHPNWGEGWGWGLFRAGDLTKNVSTNFRADCIGCHIPVREQDWVFLKGYPVLNRPGAAPETMPEPEVTEAATTPMAAAGVPASAEELWAFLKTGKYKSWAHESAMHETVGTHDAFVVAYLNAILDDSMRAANDAHPVGAMAVKERYDENRQLSGWAVSVKARLNSNGGDGWYWYEVASTTDPSKLLGNGFSVRRCVGCHGFGGRDFVRTAYPLE